LDHQGLPVPLLQAVGAAARQQEPQVTRRNNNSRYSRNSNGHSSNSHSSQRSSKCGALVPRGLHRPWEQLQQ